MKRAWVDFNDVENGEVGTLIALTNDSEDEPEGPSSHAALKRVSSRGDSTALQPCAYCGAGKGNPCRETCTGRYRP